MIQTNDIKWLIDNKPSCHVTTPVCFHVRPFLFCKLWCEWYHTIGCGSSLFYTVRLTFFAADNFFVLPLCSLINLRPLLVEFKMPFDSVAYRDEMLCVPSFVAHPSFCNSIGWAKEGSGHGLAWKKSGDSVVCVIVGKVSDYRLQCSPVGNYRLDSQFGSYSSAKFQLSMGVPEERALGTTYMTCMANLVKLQNAISSTGINRYLLEDEGALASMRCSSKIFEKRVSISDIMTNDLYMTHIYICSSLTLWMAKRPYIFQTLKVIIHQAPAFLTVSIILLFWFIMCVLCSFLNSESRSAHQSRRRNRQLASPRSISAGSLRVKAIVHRSTTSGISQRPFRWTQWCQRYLDKRFGGTTFYFETFPYRPIRTTRFRQFHRCDWTDHCFEIGHAEASKCL